MCVNLVDPTVWLYLYLNRCFVPLLLSVSKGGWAVWGQGEEAGGSQTGDGEEIRGDSEETVRHMLQNLLLRWNVEYRGTMEIQWRFFNTK